MNKSILLTIVIINLLFQSCSFHPYKIQNFSYPQPIDTRNKEISLPKKKIYDLKGIFIDTRFDGARANNVGKINDTTVFIEILPENYPINNSPWYAFKVWSDTIKKVSFILGYKHGNHRYNPKISKDGKIWTELAADFVKKDTINNTAKFRVEIDTLPVWIAAQPIINTTAVKKWIESLSRYERVYDIFPIGKSVLKREIPHFKIGNDEFDKKKKVILLFSRQHPPEVTGFFAMQFFIDELLKKDELSEQFFKNFEFWVFPLINPDGVDLGNWRHNANGIDLNRDWAYFNQPETRSVRDFIIKHANKNKQKIVLGLDFHSTFKDIFYINNHSQYPITKSFVNNWTLSINRLLSPFESTRIIEPFKKPVSKAWFYYQFGAPGVTYEVGDQTPISIIEKKARAAAVLLMDLLL